MVEQKQTILIVDDERFNINILVDLFSNNHNTMVAKNGMHALKRAQSKNPPDLILLDIMMPDMDGYEVCRQLKADESTQSIPIIFITAKAEKSDIIKGLALGAHHYITKPIDPPTITTIVKSLLERISYQKGFQDDHNKNLNSFRLLQQGQFSFHTLDEVHTPGTAKPRAGEKCQRVERVTT
jgi:CheY-like chemotaxis protein